MSSHYRPTTMGLALCTVALKSTAEKADESNWIQRRVLLNMDRNNFAVVKENNNAHLKFKTAQKLKSEGIL